MAELRDYTPPLYRIIFDHPYRHVDMTLDEISQHKWWNKSREHGILEQYNLIWIPEEQLCPDTDLQLETYFSWQNSTEIYKIVKVFKLPNRK